jgi:hypothetical protein
LAQRCGCAEARREILRASNINRLGTVTFAVGSCVSSQPRLAGSSLLIDTELFDSVEEVEGR